MKEQIPEGEIACMKQRFTELRLHFGLPLITSCSQWFPLAYKQYPLSPRAGTSWQTPSRLTPAHCPQSMCCCLATWCQEPRDSQEYGGALALRCPFFQHFLFNSGFIESILIKNSRDGAWSLQYDLPCWFGHGHITESIHGVSTPSWGTLWHHALGQTGPWPHHLTCLLLSCLSTLSTAWSGAHGRQDWYGANSCHRYEHPRTRLWAEHFTCIFLLVPTSPQYYPYCLSLPVHNCNSVPLILKAWMTCAFHSTYHLQTHVITYSYALCSLSFLPLPSLQIRCKLRKNRDLCFCSLM